MPRHGRVEHWEMVACSFSALEAFQRPISAKDVKNQLLFLVQELERASDPVPSKPARLMPSR